MIARTLARFRWSPKENVLRGRHGGLSADEMLAPLIAARLA